jgi:hypothetical protein
MEEPAAARRMSPNHASPSGRWRSSTDLSSGCTMWRLYRALNTHAPPIRLTAWRSATCSRFKSKTP